MVLRDIVAYLVGSNFYLEENYKPFDEDFETNEIDKNIWKEYFMNYCDLIILIVLNKMW